LAKELVRDFEKEYPNPLHCIWPHYIDSLEHLFKEGDTELREKSKKKLIKIYSEISQNDLPPQLGSNVWVRAPFRKFMLDGNKEDFLSNDFDKYLSYLREGEIDANCILYGVNDEINRTHDRFNKLIPIFNYIIKNKLEL
jgi:hypothetical protein